MNKETTIRYGYTDTKSDHKGTRRSRVRRRREGQALRNFYKYN